VRQRLGARGEALALALEALERLRYAPATAQAGAGAATRAPRPPPQWWAQFVAAARGARNPQP
jgi:hypothetical protein